MKKTLRYIAALLTFGVIVGGPVMAVATPVAPTAGAECVQRVLLIPTWYRNLTEGSDCRIVSPDSVGGIQPFIVRIAFNIVEMIMVIIGYIAAFFILFGGFQFVANNGSAQTVEKATRTILNAVIGLAISIASVAIINLIFGIVAPTAEVNGVRVPIATGEQVLQNILNTAYFIMGIIAVIVIVIAGFTYATSAGDSGKLTKAKNQILYAVVGIFVVLSAFVITNFVIGAF
jgi:hypothetical protein